MSSVKIEYNNSEIPTPLLQQPDLWKQLKDLYNELGALEIEQFGKWQVMEQERMYHGGKKLPMIEEIVKRGIMTWEMKDEMRCLNPILREIVVEQYFRSFQHLHEVRNKAEEVNEKINNYRQAIKKIHESGRIFVENLRDLLKDEEKEGVHRPDHVELTGIGKRERRVEKFRKAWWPDLRKASEEMALEESWNKLSWMR